MKTEQYKDHVYVSNYLATDYPDIYEALSNILSKHNIPFNYIEYTKDYWCRDFMPIQLGYQTYCQFVYNPDYLKKKQQYRTDTDFVIEKMDIFQANIEKCPLIIDGGNIVVCEEDSTNWNCKNHTIIMTDKVMLENPKYTQEQIEEIIKEALHDKDLEIVWLPWEQKEKDPCGHTDGIVKFVGRNKEGKPIILTNLTIYGDDLASRMRNILEKKFEVKEIQLSEYHEHSWAYINMLQTRDVIIIPGVGNGKTDEEAFEQIKAIFPEYGNNIYQVQMREFIAKGGGALNCCTWTVSKKMSAIPHNKENDQKYNALVKKAKANEDRISREEMFFMGDYYPLKLESISVRLDKWYWGW